MRDIEIFTTFRCNLQCPRCYTRCGRVKHPEDLSSDVFLEFIDRVEKALGHVRYAFFTGGEATLWPSLTTAIDVLKRRRLADCVAVYSNGIDRHAEDYGDADLVRLTHYGAINLADIVRLRRQLGKRLAVGRSMHVTDRAEPVEDSLPAECVSERISLAGDRVYPCGCASARDDGGIPVYESNAIERVLAIDAANRDVCRSCLANMKVRRKLLLPVMIDGGIMESPYGITWSLPWRLVRLRRWLTAIHMKRQSRRLARESR